MKVGDRKNLDPFGVGAAGASPTDVPVGRPTEGASEGGGDSVNVSSAARQLARLIAQHDAPADAVRAEKVEPLKAAVAEGRYRVDLQATARKFLREVVGDLLTS